MQKSNKKLETVKCHCCGGHIRELKTFGNGEVGIIRKIEIGGSLK